MTTAIADWIEELSRFPVRTELAERDESERRRRDAIRAFESSLPAHYRWARLSDPLLAKRVRLETLPMTVPARGNVVFMGPSGAGKTSLAVALLRALFERELAKSDEHCSPSRYRFVHARQLAVARLPGTSFDVSDLRSALNAAILLLDDIGNDCMIPSSPVSDVISERHAEERATWITTELGATQIAERYGAGIGRRIFERATTVFF
ncbi:MAG TPA: ATP-binding protein [Polyangiaceae bacterium]